MMDNAKLFPEEWIVRNDVYIDATLASYEEGTLMCAELHKIDPIYTQSHGKNLCWDWQLNIVEPDGKTWMLSCGYSRNPRKAKKAALYYVKEWLKEDSPIWAEEGLLERIRDI